MKKFDTSIKIWLQFGVGNNTRYIDVNSIYESLGASICDALPGFHAFTGCDFNPSFYRRGKRGPFNLLFSNKKYQEAFASIHDVSNIECNSEIIEDFLCKMYATKKNGLHKISNVNDARVQIFMNNYATISDEEVFKKKVITTFEACTIPPCKSELLQQIKRTVFITNMWCNADLRNPTILNPLDYGWVISDNKQYTFNWFEGDEMPKSVKDIIATTDVNPGNKILC